MMAENRHNVDAELREMLQLPADEADRIVAIVAANRTVAPRPEWLAGLADRVRTEAGAPVRRGRILFLGGLLALGRTYGSAAAVLLVAVLAVSAIVRDNAMPTTGPMTVNYGEQPDLQEPRTEVAGPASTPINLSGGADLVYLAGLSDKGHSRLDIVRSGRGNSDSDPMPKEAHEASISRTAIGAMYTLAAGQIAVRGEICTTISTPVARLTLQPTDRAVVTYVTVDGSGRTQVSVAHGTAEVLSLDGTIRSLVAGDRATIDAAGGIAVTAATFDDARWVVMATDGHLDRMPRLADLLRAE